MWLCKNNCTVDEELSKTEILSTSRHQANPLILDRSATRRTINLACGNPLHNDTVHIRAISWTLYFVALLSFGCRLVARSRKFGGIFWWDDWFIIASFVVLTAASIGAEIMVVFGLGRDTWQLDENRITIVLIVSRT